MILFAEGSREPCQDISAAGKGKGLDGERSGLWYEFERIIALEEPLCVLVENVASGAKRWVKQVRHALHLLGYDTAALAISASDVGAPHRRNRIFLVGVLADPDEEGKRQQGGPLPVQWGRPIDSGEVVDSDKDLLREQSGRRSGANRPAAPQSPRTGSLGDPHKIRQTNTVPPSHIRREEFDSRFTRSTQPRVGRDVDGLPRRVDGHLGWPAGRGEEQHWFEPPRTVPTKTIKHRIARIEALGDAIVPQCAEVVARWALQIPKVRERWILRQSNS